MKRVNILCPECFKKKLLTTDDKATELHCDNCGTEFVRTGESSVRYK